MRSGAPRPILQVRRSETAHARPVLLAAVLLGTAPVLAPARGAELAVESFSGPTPVITIRGDIQAGDDLKFTRFAAVLATAVVELDSVGGRLARH